MRLFGRVTQRERELADSIRRLKTLKVSSKGGISIDSMEIIRNPHFVKASQQAKEIVASCQSK